MFIFNSYIIVFLVLLITGCSSRKDEEVYVERTMEKIYNKGLDELSSGDYDAAAVEFDEVERQHPYSVWSRKAVLLSAYSRYKINEYEMAIATINRYIDLYPASRDIAYVYYLLAICHYEQIIDIKRDQTHTILAYESLREVINRFPDSDYAKDANYKMQLVEDHLAGKEMEVGRTYLTLKHYIAATRRFSSVVNDYDTSSHVPEALARLVEIYIILGIDKEVITNAAVLGHNYPDNYWYKYVYKTLKKQGYLIKSKSK